VAEFLNTLGDDDITIDLLEARYIVAVSAKDDKAADEWSAWRCVYAETTRDNRVYVLNDRRWYEVYKTFVEQVISDYVATPDYAGELPEYDHDSEKDYNEAAAVLLGNSCCMDCQTIQHGGGHSKIEFCDILTADHKLIHVKRNNASAQLSHLFAQGAVSGELFVQDPQFREKLNDKLPANHKLADPAAQPDPKDYEIVFGIVVGSDELDIPFFSKVSLRNTKRRLKGYGYTVSKKKISMAKKNPA
jgi:uncharacterized protein (TIGR04141 family)